MASVCPSGFECVVPMPCVLFYRVAQAPLGQDSSGAGGQPEVRIRSHFSHSFTASFVRFEEQTGSSKVSLKRNLSSSGTTGVTDLPTPAQEAQARHSKARLGDQ